MKLIKGLLILLCFSTLCAATGVSASSTIYFTKLRLTINSGVSATSATKNTATIQKLTTTRSNIYNLNSSSFRAVSASNLTNWNGRSLESSWYTFYSTGTKEIGDSFSGAGCLPGKTMISIKTAKDYSTETAFWGNWTYDS